MTLSGIKKFLEALDSAEVKIWRASVDTTPGNYYNKSDSIIILDEEEEQLVNITGSHLAPNKDQMVVRCAGLGEIHEVEFAGSLDQVKNFVEAYGLSLTDDQTQILVNINSMNYQLKPQTGDYLFLDFVEKSEEEVEAMSEEEKAKYEARLAEYQAYIKSKQFTGAAQITV